ncbi:MAG: hypothetical protein ACK5JS_01350 [Mangrovibacterium sp.]
MKNGYKIHWTTNALAELSQTTDYLETNFSDKEFRRLAPKIESTIALIAVNPSAFPKAESKNMHKAVVLKLNSLYYRI